MADEEELPAEPKLPKVLMVLTSYEGTDEAKSGFYLSEAVEPYNVFVSNGWEVAFASPAGTAVADPASVTGGDAASVSFWEDEEKKKLLTEQTKLADVPLETATTDYDALYFVGGYGCMYDLPDCAEAQALIKAFLEAGNKPVAAVCHGPIVLANIVMGDETPLLVEKECTGFSDAEETAMGSLETIAALPTGTCQTAMAAKCGKLFKVGAPFAPRICKAGTLFTGGNPASAAPLATEVVYFFDAVKAEFEPPRLALLKKREVCVGEIEKMDGGFKTSLDALKKEEAAGAAGVAEKLEELTSKVAVEQKFRSSILTDIDNQLERNAVLRKAKIDKLAADAAAAEEE